MKIVWIIIASSLIVAGILVLAVSLIGANFNFAQIFKNTLVSNTHELTESFDSLDISISTADITFIPSADGKCKVECYEYPKVKHSVSVKDGKLNINVVDERKWYEHIGITISEPNITVYLPKTEYDAFELSTDTGDVHIPDSFKFSSIEITGSTADVDCNASCSGLMKIETTTGDIEIEGVSVGELALSVSTGDIEVESVNCAGNAWIYVTTGYSDIKRLNCLSFTSDGSTGDINMSEVIASEKLSIIRSTGDVSFENSDAKEFSVETDTGDVDGTLRSPKIFTVITSTGDVNVPESTMGGKCKIKTSTGDITVYVK